MVIEGFGYAYSDLGVANRTVENITADILEVLGRLGVHEPVILVGHSIGGIYTHYYANAYPGEVSAIVGIDPTPATASSLAVGTPSRTEGILSGLGLYRWVTSLAPGLIQPPGTAYTAYTASERERTAALSRWNYGNPSIADEWAQLGANSTRTSVHPFPRTLPVLEFLATESVKTMPDSLSKHEAELASVIGHQLQLVDCAHYLRWTQSPLLGRAISDLVGAQVAPEGPVIPDGTPQAWVSFS